MVKPGTGDGAGDRPVAADGPRPQEGPDLPQLRRQQQVRRLRRLPGRLDVQAVRAGRGASQQGLPASTSFNSPAQVHIPQNEFADCDGQHSASTDTWEPHNSTDDGYFNMYTGHPALGEHLLRPAGEEDRAVRALSRWPSRWASSSTDPRTELVPSFTLGVADVSPLEMAGAYATVAARGQYCDPQPGDQDPEQLRQGVQGLPAAVPAGDAQDTADTINDILHGVSAAGRVRRSR